MALRLQGRALHTQALPAPGTEWYKRPECQRNSNFPVTSNLLSIPKLALVKNL